MPGTIFTATIGATRSRVSTVLSGRYEMDGEAIGETWEAGSLPWSEILAIAALPPGGSVVLGGGAFAETMIRRMEG